jgi:two-component system response regulator WspF
LHKIELIGRLVDSREKAPREGRDAVRSRPPAPAAAPAPGVDAQPSREPLVVLGASTGGPQALAEILGQLPARLGAGIVIVQHVDAAFAPGLGQWLSEQARRPVTLIAEGHWIVPGEVLLAGTGDHLVLGEDRRLHYSAEPRSACYRPSVDVFFASAARNWPGPGVAALLTGMLHDGAQGLLALRRRGWRTIAQDESSSVVWGMPKAAIELDAAELVLTLSEIAGAIARLVETYPVKS